MRKEGGGGRRENYGRGYMLPAEITKNGRPVLVADFQTRGVVVIAAAAVDADHHALQRRLDGLAVTLAFVDAAVALDRGTVM